MPGDTRYANWDDENHLIEKVAALQRRIEDLERNPRSTASSVDRGTLTIRDGTFRVRTADDVNVLYVGPVVFGSDTTPGWLFRRSNGHMAFSLAGDSVDDQYWSWYDDSGNLLISDDSASNQGLARPYIPLPFQDSSSNVNFTNTTTNATFTALQTCRYKKQHPKVDVYCLVRASDGTTTGELRLGIGGTPIQIGANVNVTAGMFAGVTLGGEIPGSHLSTMELEVQGRRTAGAGTIGVRVLGAYAVQS